MQQSLLIGLVAVGLLTCAPGWGQGMPYEDGRPHATQRMDAEDHGVVLRHGDGPRQCDTLAGVYCEGPEQKYK